MSSFPPDKIEAQLKRILATPEFVTGKKMSRFLQYVVEQSLNGQSGSIKQYTIAVEALGYEADFDPTANPSVRTVARRLRRALEQYYSTNGLEDPIRIDIPKGSYVPVSSENRVPPNEPVGNECPSPVTEQTSLDLSGPTIAVIMFDYLNGKDEFDYFAVGLTEEIIISLTRFPDFVVIGPLSRNKIRKEGLNVRSIGQNYGVRFVLDGTIRKRGDAIRLTAKLADTISSANLWGQSMNYSLGTTSIQEIEDQVVGEVASTVGDTYGVICRTLAEESLTHHSDTLSDYDAILRFYHYFRFLEGQSFMDAMEALEKVLKRNPRHALAAAMLGDLVACIYQFGFEDSTSFLDRSEELGRQAVAIDPNCQQAHFTMALVHFLRGQRDLFLGEVEKTLQLNPNNTFFVACSALHLGMVGEWERGLELVKKAMRLNPHHLGHYHWVPFMNYYLQGEYDLALKKARKYNAPHFFWDPLNRAAVLGQMGRQTEAKKAVDEILALVPDFSRRGRRLIRRFAYLDEHVDALAEGLQKAGLETQSEA